VVICLERGADLLMPLPLTVSCFSKIQIGFTFLVPAHLGSHGKGPLNVCVCVCVCVCVFKEACLFLFRHFCFAEDYGRLIEIYDFPEGMITRDLLILFKEFR